MRILHCCPLPSFSGLEQYALLTAKRQMAMGCDVLFVVQAGSTLAKECASAGVPTLPVTVPQTFTLFSLASQYALILKSSLESSTPFDIIHLHSSQDIDRFGLAFGILKVQRPTAVRPKLIQQNHIWISHSKKDPLHLFTYHFVDQVWCSSQAAKKSLESFLPVPKAKIKVVNYGRDLSLRDEFLTRSDARAKLGLGDDEIVIGAIARIDPAKGVFELVSAAVNCLREGFKFALVVIGGPTNAHPPAVKLNAEILKFLSELPDSLSRHIKMTGPIENAATLLRAFDVYAQGSYKETFSLALLDAQLAGLPVIGTSSGGTPEVVVESRTGWLAEPESVSSMTETLKRALRDQDRWPSFGASARARVEAEFSLEAAMSQMQICYTQK